jgi:hypothetical protein
MALQIRRGPTAQRASILLQNGEVAWTTDTKKLYVGDGVTTGGVNILANVAGTGFVWNPSTEQLDLAGSTITGINADNVAETNGIIPRLWYRSSLGKTHASQIFTASAGAAHTGISFSWDDVNEKLTATVLTENSADAAAALFTSGTHTGISFAYGLTEDAANRIDATVSAEYIQDTVNDLFTAGVHTGITFTYSDALNALSAAVNFPQSGGDLGSNLILTSSYNIQSTALSPALTISGSTGNITTTGSITAGGFGNVNAKTILLTDTIIATGIATFTSSTISGTTLTLTRASGTISVGMIITGGTTIAGTYIVSNLSGVGGSGVSTWTVNTSQTTSGATTGTPRGVNAGMQIESNQGSGTGGGWLSVTTAHNDAGQAAGALFARSRGTMETPLAIQNGDLIFSLAFSGKDATGDIRISAICGASVAGPVSNGVIPGQFIIGTTDLTGTFAPRLIVGPDGKQSITAPSLVAGASSGQVNTGTISTWMKVNFNGTDYAMPLYQIRP